MPFERSWWRGFKGRRSGIGRSRVDGRVFGDRAARREEDGVGEAGHADADRGVGDVEDWPEGQVDEVDDVADVDAVDQVANRAAHLEAQADVEQPRWLRDVAVGGDDHR